tara:strand:- start:19082 stop:19507 length:426 start_codon:yes stop_codon:yes gene_type:complete
VAEWVTYTIVAILILLSVANIVSFRQSRELRAFLNAVARPVPSDYFDPFSAKAGDLIQYRKTQVSGASNVSSEGIYLESVFKFHVVIPWAVVIAIRVLTIKGKLVANLKISHNNEIDRELIISWHPDYNEFIPKNVIIVRG